MLQTEKPVGSIPQGILTNDATRAQLMCSKFIMLSSKSLYMERNLFQIASSSDLTSVSKVKPENNGAVTTENKNNIIWKRYGCFPSTNLHKAHLCTNY